MTNPGMKCSRCRGPARHRLPAHNARFCDQCLEVFLQRQVAKAIKQFRMLRPGQEVVAAVSGGKDSLVLWKVLLDLGYQVRALHLDLELGDFSRGSLDACQAMARRLGEPLMVRNVRELLGASVDQIVAANRREFCSVCGTLKRHLINRICAELDVDTVASGHHLDDEAGRLLGNLMRGHQQYLDNQWPVLEGLRLNGRIGLARKVKPLCRLGGEEIQAYALSLDLPFLEGRCPRSKGATLPYYQQAVRYLERKMPGTRRDFYLGFLRRKGGPPPPPEPAGTCNRCGAPTYVELCTTCRLLERTHGHHAAGGGSPRMACGPRAVSAPDSDSPGSHARTGN